MHHTYIFDFDGTLVDSMPSWAEKVLNILRECDVEYPSDIINTVTPLGDRGTAEYFRDVLGVPLSLEEMFARMDAFALPKYRDEIGIKDGVREYLAGLRAAGCTLHVLTASPHKMVDPCLKRLGIFDWFDNVWSTDDFGMVKSDTAIYRAAAERIGVDVSDAVFFDDNLTAIRTARAAGMYAVGVYDASSDALAEEIREAADRYVRSMTELPGTKRFFVRQKMNKYKNYFINLIFPAVIFGSVTGILTAVVITLYKLCAKHVIAASEAGYHFLRENLIWVIPVLAALVGVSFLFAYIYRRVPNLKGGGIPTSIGMLRGILPCRWESNLVGLFFMSLTSFLIGVPLGNEGPSVQMGAAVGRGSVRTLAKKHRAWNRYSMTGGACAGFSIATGAPISGVLFAIEEAHQRVSPMILIVAATSVLAGGITTEILSPLFSVSTSLFPKLDLIILRAKDIWIPLAVGIVMGLFAVLFLRYYTVISSLWKKKLKNVPHAWKIFSIFALTVFFGILSHSFISTGHELILHLFEERQTLIMLLLILVVRSTLTLCANTNGITGGIFLPLLTLGAVIASAMGQICTDLFGLGEPYYVLILVLGITGCIAGMMKMPLTAIVFAVEALSCYDNILYVIIVAVTAFIITEIFDVHSINDTVLEGRAHAQNEGKEFRVIDTFVTVQPGAFAEGKQIRDIFWPRNLFVLSVQHGKKHGAEVDEHGGKEIREGDILHVRYSTYDEEKTAEELMAIVGEQAFARSVDEVV